MVRKGVKIGPLRVEPHKGLGGKRFGEGPTGVKVPAGAKVKSSPLIQNDVLFRFKQIITL